VDVNWDDLRYLLALRRAGSLGSAARLLKVEPSTASRRLASLEGALGAKLAARTPEGLSRSEAFLVIPPDHRNTVRVRLVMDAVAALFERERALLER
jgi:hypothetical protein